MAFFMCSGVQVFKCSRVLVGFPEHMNTRTHEHVLFLNKIIPKLQIRPGNVVGDADKAFALIVEKIHAGSIVLGGSEIRLHIDLLVFLSHLSMVIADTRTRSVNAVLVKVVLMSYGDLRGNDGT